MILEKIDQDLLALAKQSDNDLKDIYAQVDELCLVNSNKAERVKYNAFVPDMIWGLTKASSHPKIEAKILSSLSLPSS